MASLKETIISLKTANFFKDFSEKTEEDYKQIIKILDKLSHGEKLIFVEWMVEKYTKMTLEQKENP